MRSNHNPNDNNRKQKKRKRSGPGVIWMLFGLLTASLLGSVTLGRYPIGLRETLGILIARLADALHLGTVAPFWSPTQASLFINHRLPRVLLACLVGGCLSTAGAAYQGVFHNPMAAPDLLGASSGAAFGAALAILLDLGSGMILLFAFAASLATVLLVLFLGSRATKNTKGDSLFGLILAGVLMSSLVSAGTSWIKLAADPENQLPAITYWLMGSLNGTHPEDVRFALFPMLLGFLPLFLLRWRLNLLTLGDEEARTMGVPVKPFRILVILCATLMTAASVSVSGTIGWVGLVIPHLARKLAGNNYVFLLPACALSGAVFLLLVDDLSRNLCATEIPIGILTALLGAPFSAVLIARDGET